MIAPAPFDVLKEIQRELLPAKDESLAERIARVNAAILAQARNNTVENRQELLAAVRAHGHVSLDRQVLLIWNARRAIELEQHPMDLQGARDALATATQAVKDYQDETNRLEQAIVAPFRKAQLAAEAAARQAGKGFEFGALPGACANECLNCKARRGPGLKKLVAAALLAKESLRRAEAWSHELYVRRADSQLRMDLA